MQKTPDTTTTEQLTPAAIKARVGALREQAISHAERAARSRRFFEAPAIIATYTAAIDEILKEAWALCLTGPSLPASALIAVGGYGRGELHPYSDIDVMILCDRKRPALADAVSRFLRFLWDAGLSPGNSVRTPAECGRECRRDVTVATNVMESRLLAGDGSLLDRATTASSPPKVWGSEKFLAAKHAEQMERHRRFGDTGYSLEPNLKDGPGGLRDLQTIVWIARRHEGAASLQALADQGVITALEYHHLSRHRDFLWLVRILLHGLAGRREERLVFDHQRGLAQTFGYHNRPGRLAVEQFMKRYYRTVKEVALFNEILIAHYTETIAPPRRDVVVDINRRFRARNGRLEHRDSRVFSRQPFAILEAFLLLEQHQELIGLRADTIRLLLAHLPRIDAAFRRSLAARSLFMELLREPAGITHELRRMNAYGVLGRYIPAFGRIVGQMQHDLFHVYTVDEHILFVVRNLRRLQLKQFAHEFPLASTLMQDMAKPERLYLAALFHDIAKGRGGDHSELGATEVRRFSEAHGLSAYDTNFICWLVEKHLLMSQVAQKSDITDPEVVAAFAREVGDPERLHALYLLTVADMRATSPSVWNSWKDRLLSELHRATIQLLRRGVGLPIDAQAHADDLRRDALARFPEAERAGIETLWERLGLDRDYFLRYDADRLSWHARLLRDASTPPAVAARFEPRVGATELFLLAPDTDGLFARVTGILARLSLSIVDARIHTVQALAIDTFAFLDQRGLPVTEEAHLREIEEVIRRDLSAPQADRIALSPYVPRALKHFPRPTEVTFRPAPHRANTTLMEVRAQDRPGLLHQIALALVECGAQIMNARVATYGERAEDLFFITSAQYPGATLDADMLVRIERRLHERLADPQDEHRPAHVAL